MTFSPGAEDWVEYGPPGARRRVGFHDYAALYGEPGLYERVFYEELGIDLHVDLITGEDKTIDVVVDLFNKVNSGGTKLSKGDLALATLCAAWPEAREQLQLRLRKWERAGFSFTLDWLLRAINAIVTGRAEFSALADVTPARFREGVAEAERAIDATLNLISSRLGLDHARVLGAVGALPLMSRFIADRGFRLEDAAIADRLLFWYVQCLLWGRYAGSTETVLNVDLAAIGPGDATEPDDLLDRLIVELRHQRGDLRIGPDDFRGWSRGARFYPLLYLLSRVGGARDLGSGLELRRHLLGQQSALEVHHVFPKESTTLRGATATASSPRWSRCSSTRSRSACSPPEAPCFCHAEAMSVAPYIEELRLTAFKSFKDGVLPLSDLTLLIGRNGSGKSNAIDGLQVLAKLAQVEDIRDAVEGGRREGSEVRGGTRGCAPFGESCFELGCRVRAGRELFELDVEVQVDPDMQIRQERLCLVEFERARPLLSTDPPDVDQRRHSRTLRQRQAGKEPRPAVPLDRLLTSQVPTKVPTSTKPTQRVHRGATAVLEALESVFVLDPVPALMRQYVPQRDTVLRRQADNLSAAVGSLLADPATADRLRELIRSLPQQPIDDVTVQSSPLGDVILALEERVGQVSVPVSARVMSDGMLRFIAFATALLESPLLGAGGGPGDRDPGHTMPVIEEIVNGLHPSQAAKVVDLIREESRRREVRTLATTLTGDPDGARFRRSPGRRGLRS